MKTRYITADQRLAFSLTEILIVIAIIAILMALSFYGYSAFTQKARDTGRKEAATQFLTDTKQFQDDQGVFPNFSYSLGVEGNLLQYFYHPIAADGIVNNQNLNLANKIANCQQGGPGDPAKFLTTVTGPPFFFYAGWGQSVPAPGDPIYNYLTVYPGFKSVNALLYCLGYTTIQYSDAQHPNDGYQYRVSYDFQNILIGAKLENTQNQSQALLFTGHGNDGESSISEGKYFIGSSQLQDNRQLDDDSNEDLAHGGFVDSFTDGSGQPHDGQYLFQCENGNPVPGQTPPLDRGWSAYFHMTPDLRSNPLYKPIILDPADDQWKVNPNCVSIYGFWRFFDSVSSY